MEADEQTGANKRNRPNSTRSVLQAYLKHPLMDSRSSAFIGHGHRSSGHSLQMLDSIGLLLGQDARREALLLMLVDLKIVPPGARSG
jgi:hypothetical protein